MTAETATHTHARESRAVWRCVQQSSEKVERVARRKRCTILLRGAPLYPRATFLDVHTQEREKNERQKKVRRGLREASERCCTRGEAKVAATLSPHHR